MFLVNAVVLSKHSFGLIPKVFDTVDVIADTVGIAKASLYRHFPSKEALGMAALVDIMHKTLEVIKLQSNIPGLAILYTLYARACDPVLGFLRSSQLYDDDEIIAIVTRTCFEGLT